MTSAETHAEADPSPGAPTFSGGASGSGRRTITPLGVLGIAIALLVVAGLALWPLAPGEVDLSDDANLLAAFEVEREPLGWTRVSARKLRGGKEVYLFEDPDAEAPAPLPIDPEPESKPKPKGKSSGGGGRGGRGSRDKKRWSRLVEGAAGQPPRRVALVKLPVDGAKGQLRELFFGLKFRDLEKVDEKGGEVPMEGGRFDWGAYEAPYLRVRHLYAEDDKPTFHETIRVNLTVGREAWVAILEWDPREPGDVEWAKRAVRGLRAR